MSTAQNPPRILGVSVVEGIHAAAAVGKHQLVAETVAGLEDATLPGLVGYLCLRYRLGHDLSLPELPPVVLQSPVARALYGVVCSFGLRTEGMPTPLTQLTARPVEFFVLRNQGDVTGHHYKLFEARWATACDDAGFRTRSTLLHYAMTAMTENAVLHAQSAAGILVGYRRCDHAVLFTVADLGRGTLGSLKSNQKYAYLEYHRDALKLALQDGVSCLGDRENGYGFHQLFRALASQYGTLRFRTGNVCITMDGQDFNADIGDESHVQLLDGFQVTMCCRSRPTEPGEDSVL